jgi:uncharacterized protein (DUF3084 family)
MSNAGVGILGGAVGAGITYVLTKPKIQRLEAENEAKRQHIDALQNENQILRNTIYSRDNIISQKEEVIRQKDTEIAVKDAEIVRLKEERKRALSN